MPRKGAEYFVYAVFVDVVDRTYVKIGRARNVLTRLKVYQTACPLQVRKSFYCNVETLSMSIVKEKAMHDEYARCRQKGEWFTPWDGIASNFELRTFETGMVKLMQKGRAYDDQITAYSARPKKVGKKDKFVEVVRFPIVPPRMPPIAILLEDLLKDDDEADEPVYRIGNADSSGVQISYRNPLTRRSSNVE